MRRITLFHRRCRKVAKRPVKQQTPQSASLIDRCRQCRWLVQAEQQVDHREQSDLWPPNFAVHAERDEHIAGAQVVGDRAQLIGWRVQKENEIGEKEEHTEVGLW